MLYAMRAHRTFGYVVFLFEEIQTSEEMPPDEKGATPFDTDGLWIGAIRPIEGRDAKRSMFAREEVGLECWRSELLTYVDRNYPNAQDCVVGEPPAFGVDGITTRRCVCT